MREKGPESPDSQKGEQEKKERFEIGEPLQPLTFGNSVRIKNEEGQIEDGWMVRNVHDDGTVEVIYENKDTARKMLDPIRIDAQRKLIPLAELQKLNPESEAPEFNLNYLERSAVFFDRVSEEAEERGDLEVSLAYRKRASATHRKIILIERREREENNQ